VKLEAAWRQDPSADALQDAARATGTFHSPVVSFLIRVASDVVCMEDTTGTLFGLFLRNRETERLSDGPCDVKFAWKQGDIVYKSNTKLLHLFEVSMMRNTTEDRIFSCSQDGVIVDWSHILLILNLSYRENPAALADSVKYFE